MKKSLSKNSANILLLAVTLIWGSGFVVTKYTYSLGVTPGMVNIIRGGIFMLLTFCVFTKKVVKMRWKDVIAGLIAGITNAVAYIFQSLGLAYTTPSVSSFLTVLHIVIVPILALIVFKRKPGWKIVPAVIISLIGAFILTGMTFNDFSLGKGEILTLAGTVSFAISITYIGDGAKEASPECIAFWMGVTQMLAGVICFFMVDDYQSVASIDWKVAVLPLIYLGVFGTFFTTNAQVFAQKATSETSASMIMTMEAVFGTVISIIVGYDKFTWQLLIGGLLIFSGMIIAVLDFRKIFLGKQ